MQDIHDIHPPVQAGFDPGPVIIVLSVLVLVLILVTIFFLITRRLKNKKTDGTDPGICSTVSPYEAAITALERLSIKIDHEPRLFYFKLNAVLRKYIGESFSINAAEMTSQEFIKAVRILKLDSSIKNEIIRFQDLCDPIKYAGILPETGRMHSDLTLVKQEVEKIQVLIIAAKEEEKQAETARAKGGDK